MGPGESCFDRFGASMIPASLSALASVCVAVLTALAALPAAAAVELNPSHPETYVVQPGDTLWGIAGRFLREPWQWRKIWQANSDIRNPDQIFPGDVLRLTYRNGEPRVRLERGMRTVKLSPRVRVTQLQQPVPTIPIGIIRPFLTRAYVLDKAEMDAAPYVVDFPDEHIVGGLHDSAYVRSMYGTERQHFAIVRPGEALRDGDRRSRHCGRRWAAAAELRSAAGTEGASRPHHLRSERGVPDRPVQRRRAESRDYRRGRGGAGVRGLQRR
jgi:hypothetical protein